jgi:hypothetical protein
MLAALAAGRPLEPQQRPPGSPAPRAEPTPEIVRVTSGAAYDSDHPEELAYRPFPVAPYLTASASPDDPALLAFVAPDSLQTIDLIDVAGSMPPMYLRPSEQIVRTLWAQTFNDGSGYVPDRRPTSDIPERRVPTKPQ